MRSHVPLPNCHCTQYDLNLPSNTLVGQDCTTSASVPFEKLCSNAPQGTDVFLKNPSCFYSLKIMQYGGEMLCSVAVRYGVVKPFHKV